MNVKQLLSDSMPWSLKRPLRVRRHKKKLMSIQPLACDAKNLRSMGETSLTDLLDSGEVERMWRESNERIAPFAIPEGTGGVNLGDRRAIYFLIGALKPSSVLEIGTHIGASTVNISSALFASRIRPGQSARLVSVDVSDVNDAKAKPWLKYGVKESPREMVRTLGHEGFVEFVVDASLSYFSKQSQSFDFVFLDGDHSAGAVYREIPAALKILNHNGVILLHDYFPKLEPLWSDGSMLPGPFLATERLAREGAGLAVLPLGELPWPTKLRSNVTSLALLLRNK